ncbi:MAG TPA: MmcB family DNA repair protein, partial [Geminicoccaceae bacterium]|nr:MmcB family DNA repair protein [Geminicoccaceae bacterium]
KSCRADFRGDRKWHEYLAFCDRFYFAVARDFPLDLLPAEEGVILADRFGAEIVRPARLRALGPARRKAMLIRFGRAAATRLHGLLDPRL